MAFDAVDIIKVIKDLKTPSRLLLAETGSTTKALSSFRGKKNSSSKIVENSTHFIPMEFPEIVQREILELLRR